ncbi:MAG: hypoxanthine phosphoribosyltransferase [Candidatus Zixiibacteriota bacterium]
MKSEGSQLQIKPFELLFPQNEIERVIASMGKRLSKDYAGKNPIFLGVLKGCFVFMADLVRAMSVPIEAEFISAHSYGSGMNPGKLTLSGGSDVSLKGRHILLVEGVVDTGRTVVSIVETIKSMEPASVEIVTLLDKTGRRESPIQIKYAGFHVDNDFVIGYGLDHNQLYRNLPFIGKVIEQKG